MPSHPQQRNFIFIFTFILHFLLHANLSLNLSLHLPTVTLPLPLSLSLPLLDISYGLDGPGIESRWGWGQIFRSRGDRPSGSTSLLPGRKAAGAWR